MQFLMLYISETEPFDLERVRVALSSIEGVTAVRDTNLVAAALECEFDWRGELVIARLTEDRMAVAIDRTGEGSRRLVIEFQRRYGEPLHLIDDEYCFDELVTSETTLADLETWISVS